MPRLTLPELQSIRRLLRAGMRHFEIARQLDLGVGTISRVAADRKLRRRRLALLREQDLPDDDPPPAYVAANLRRCSGCGGMVYQWPCLLCRLQKERDLGRKPALRLRRRLKARRTKWQRAGGGTRKGVGEGERGRGGDGQLALKRSLHHANA
jgi:hypothetical protein